MKVVREAIERDVDAVVVTGDVIDRENRYFEAFGDFEAGVKELTSSGIPVRLVSGNHDFDVTPEVIDNLSKYDIRQLGKNGNWEEAKLTRKGKSVVRLVGWSFPDQHVEYNPLKQLDLNFQDFKYFVKLSSLRTIKNTSDWLNSKPYLFLNNFPLIFSNHYFSNSVVYSIFKLYSKLFKFQKKKMTVGKL